VSETGGTPTSADAVARADGSRAAVRDATLSPDPADLEAQIEQTRQQLATTIDEIAERVHPKNVARRALERARAVVVDEYGEIRPEGVAIVGTVALALVGLVLLRRARARR